MCGKTPKDPPKRAKRKEMEGQAILTSELPTMNTEKKTQLSSEIDAEKPITNQKTTTIAEKERKEKRRNQKVITDDKEKEKERKRKTYLRKTQHKLEAEIAGVESE